MNRPHIDPALLQQIDQVMARVQSLPNWVELLRLAKQAEEQASAQRLWVEAAIVDQVEKPASGEGSVKLDDVTISFKVTRTLDNAKLAAAWGSLPSNAQRAFSSKYALDLKYLRALAELDAATYFQVSQFITSKDAKPALTLKADE